MNSEFDANLALGNQHSKDNRELMNERKPIRPLCNDKGDVVEYADPNKPDTWKIV